MYVCCVCRTDVLCMFVVFACIEWCPTRIYYMSRMAVSYRRQEMLTLNIMGDCVHPRFVLGSVLLIVFVFYVVFLFCLFSLCACVRNVASSSGLSIFDCSFGFL
jgi:hypothetical protein